jgi:hypothetical protein
MLRHVMVSLSFLLMSCIGVHAADDRVYSCAVGETPPQALQEASAGRAKMKLTIAGDSFEIAGLGSKGTLGAAGSSDGAFLAEAGPVFADVQGHLLKGANSLDMGRAAFARDANGTAVAYLTVFGLYHVACHDAAKTAANFSSAGQQDVTATPPQPLQDPDRPLTDEEKDEKLFAEAPVQKGKERSLFGAIAISPPAEGHYDCTRVNYYSDETKKSNQIDSDNDHSGFDLFADGTVRLKKADGKYEDDGDDWRHNPKNGVVLFQKGTLSVYFKWPIHVRKVFKDGVSETSLLYIIEYDYDGSVDEMTMCVNIGPTASKSPKAANAEVSAKNLNPPPPGSTVKVAGLYYEQRWVPMMGFGNPPQMYQEDYYYYRYFQDNGYVWLGDPPADGDFSKLDCSKPMVDEKGEPLCTTYDVTGGLLSSTKIRIGHDSPVPFVEDDGTMIVDGTAYHFVPPQDDLKIDKFVKYFGYNGIAAREGSITFKGDGRYESTSWSGVSFTTEIPDVSRTTVVSSNPGEDLQGVYKIEGHSITFTADTGKVAKTFFGKLGDGFFMVGGQPYFEPSD